MEGYCIQSRGRAKREIQRSQKVTVKNGKPAAHGTCPVCSAKLFRMGAKA